MEKYLKTVKQYAGNGGRTEKHSIWMETFSKKAILVLIALCMTVMFSCDKDGDDDGDGGQSVESVERAELDKAIYCINYAIRVSTDYNDNNSRPSNLTTGGQTIATVAYLPNGSLSHMSFSQREPLTSKMTAPFHIDVGRRPSTVCAVETLEQAITYASIKGGTYDFDTDPAKLIACFAGYMIDDKFKSLSNLRILTNNSDITEDIYKSIYTPTSCYKIIVYGKNKAGKLVGKYVGYSLGKTFEYWNINPESPSFGKPGTRIF
jgi:hypothetical protein